MPCCFFRSMAVGIHLRRLLLALRICLSKLIFLLLV